ncbi:MAG: DUF3108 domain-containing protein [Gemmatimonadaceae bacterium]
MIIRSFILLTAGAGALAMPTAPRDNIHAAVADSSRCSPNETLVSPQLPSATATTRHPFTIGEHLHYNVKFGIMPVGSGVMWLTARDTTRGIGTWRAMFATSGGFGKLSAHDTSTSWFDSVSFTSYRFVEHVHDPGYHALRDTQIYPERMIYRKNDESEEPSVSGPMDEVSLVYFVRTLPLEPHECYVLNRYFKPDGNPVVIHVLRREEIKVPAGKFKAIVVRPEITTSGMFSKGGKAELWLSDDSARVVLQLRSKVPKLPFGSLSLFLTRVESEPPR